MAYNGQIRPAIGPISLANLVERLGPAQGVLRDYIDAGIGPRLQRSKVLVRVGVTWRCGCRAREMPDRQVAWFPCAADDPRSSER